MAEQIGSAFRFSPTQCASLPIKVMPVVEEGYGKQVAQLENLFREMREKVGESPGDTN